MTNPTTQWSQLDHPADKMRQAASPSGLKNLIERKKHDDSVRVQELGLLRKLLRRRAPADTGMSPDTSGSTAHEVAGDRSMSDTSLDPVGVQEKIDQLDAQMSGHRPQPVSVRGADAPMVPLAAELTGQDSVSTPPDPITNVPTLERSGSVGMALDPAIEEVAIHFANGGFEETESRLLGLVGAGGERRDDEQIWLMLFDFYRATGQASKFDELGVEFAEHFGRSSPQWLRKPDATGAAAATGSSKPRPPTWSDDTGKPDWQAPSLLDEAAIGQLQVAPARGTKHWFADWMGLEVIDPAALPGLVDVLQRWAGQTTVVTFVGTQNLLRVLTAQTPLHDKSVDANWWLAQLALLRLLNRAEAFDETALAYCVTYEVSPPAWEGPLCQVVLPDIEVALTGVGSETTFTPTLIMPENQIEGASHGVYRLRLQGEILDDIDGIVGRLQLPEDVHTVECDCEQLRRVDFGAASALFNWVTEQQRRNRHVVFVDVNRLVAVFFSIVGIAGITTVIRSVD